MKLYVYHRPNVMVGHTYTDDVAICYAKNKKEAIEKFKLYYSEELLKDSVEEIYLSKNNGVAILTSY